VNNLFPIALSPKHHCKQDVWNIENKYMFL